MKYEGVNDEGKILAKGVETARRDNCQMVVDCMTAIMQKLFVEGDKDGAVAALHATLRDLIAGRMDIGKLVISKAISKENYKNEPPHLAVARKMKARDPSYESGPAERIPFVVVANGGKTVAERAEDPLWSIKQQMALDLDYYIMKQLAGPVARILMWVYGSGQDKHTVEKYEQHLRDVQEKIPDDFTRIKKAREGLVKQIKLMQEHVIKHFFGGSALSVFPRKIQSTAGRKGSIDSFFRASTKKRCIHGNDSKSCEACTRRCDGCKNELGEYESLCPRCNPHCTRCGGVVAQVSEGDGLCIPCAEHLCQRCSTALAPEQQFGLCKECDTREQIRKRHKITLINTTGDIEDLVKQAAEAKLKCDKCRGYSDETEIKCVQKDCLTLYRRATLEMRIKNTVVVA
jgi:hypothetical protein